ncbi:MAG TPA: Sua5/YciO/YrdC/YwlC family protein, partial [Actinomycetota bacterium]|nr:Sua5/YciO/YrdC/YwlC family protein [Actinomycetota bacterium]
MPEAVEKAASLLETGELVVIPTDTVYGIAASAANANAVARIFQVKSRSTDKPIPVLVHSLEVARELGELNSDAEKIAVSAWPGAVTIVVP